MTQKGSVFKNMNIQHIYCISSLIDLNRYQHETAHHVISIGAKSRKSNEIEGLHFLIIFIRTLQHTCKQQTNTLMSFVFYKQIISSLPRTVP